MFDFKITHRDTTTSARIGAFATPHGVIKTPVFMPCGTKGTVKTLTPEELKSLGCEIMLSNTYHLMLRPGSDLVEKMGGLHTWIGWDRPILTDSGGYQVFSLADLRTLNDEGVTFQSHIDGSRHTMTPESTIAIEEQLGADIIMPLDECAPPDADLTQAKKALERTQRWLERCIKAKKRSDQALFPIVQGSTFPELRKAAAQFITQFDTPGFAIGGVAVGEGKEKMREVIHTVAPLLPDNKPRYLMGVGEPIDIVEAVVQGIDMFDCVIPTRLARHGSFWTREKGVFERATITKAEFKESTTALEPGCGCYTCLRFSKSYIRHLMVEGEMLGHRLLTIHNLHYLFQLMRDIRTAIQNGTFSELISFYRRPLNKV